MLSRSAINKSIVSISGLKKVLWTVTYTLAMIACTRCTLFGGIQAAGAALFAAGMCTGWNCGVMMLGCALGCATFGSMDSIWPAFACLSVWLMLSVAGSVELMPYPSNHRVARMARKLCMTARGEGSDAARVALAACAAGGSNMIMTLVLAGMAHSSVIYCVLSALLGFGLTPAFAIGLGGMDVPEKWQVPSRALLAGICSAGLLGLNWGVLEPGTVTAAAILTALISRVPGKASMPDFWKGLVTGSLVGVSAWLAGGDAIQSLGYAVAGSVLSGFGGLTGFVVCWCIIVLSSFIDNIGANGNNVQSIINAVYALDIYVPVLLKSMNALAGMIIGHVIYTKLDIRDTRKAQVLLERCVALERNRIEASAARLAADLNDLLSAGGGRTDCPNDDEQYELQHISDSRKVELMQRISRLAYNVAARRSAILERQHVDIAASQSAMKRLTCYGLDCECVCITADLPRRAYISVRSRLSLHDVPESIERALTYVTGARFEYESGEGDDLLVLRQCGELDVRGAVRRSACGRIACGDSAILTRLDDGRYLAGLSDGMGKGEAAARESHAALAAIERLLDCGIAPGQALDAVNELLLLSGAGEMYTTLDIALIDPATGRADMYKLGSLPSIIVNGSRARLIGAYAPPFGILERVHAAQRTVHLRAGDRFILFSDGVCDLSDDTQADALTYAIRALADAEPGEAAEKVISRMKHRFESDDDAAIVVVDVLHRDMAWRGRLAGRGRSALI